MIVKYAPALILLVIATLAYGKEPSKIYRGTRCKLGEVPSMASLFVDLGHICGGTIIHERFILTAAHCVSKLTQRQIDTMIVRTGSINSRRGGQEHYVDKIWYHQNYDASRQDSRDDIALIQLLSRIEFNSYQSPMPLETGSTGDSELVLSSGWGTTETNPESSSEYLKKVFLTTIDSSRCRQSLGSRVWQRQICVLGRGGEGVCSGDSGGPLINSQGKLIGIVSWGIVCAQDTPEVFTRVSQYIGWINNIING